MSRTRPLAVSTRIQSPMRTELSSCTATPASSTPSVSIAKATTAVDRRGGDDAGEIESGAAQLGEAVDHVHRHNAEVLDDARRLASGQRQQQAEDGEAQKADECNGGDEARNGMHRVRRVGEVQRPSADAAALAADAEQEEPQRVEERRAFRRACVQQREGHAERRQRQPRRGRAQNPNGLGVPFMAGFSR